jgi:cytochrome P450/NADPH-cytochrome P450 reductase
MSSVWLLNMVCKDIYTPRVLTGVAGSIFKVSLGAGNPDRIVICSVELLNEICDEKRFAKNPTAGGLAQVRTLLGDALFTALDGEENWGLAHRTLMPVLGPVAIGDMFDGT